MKTDRWFECIIVEDEASTSEVLTHYIQKLGNLNLVGTFTTVSKARNFLEKNAVDLIFLDIHLPGFSGMELLKSLSSSIKIILITADKNYAIEAFEYEALDYLLKPVSFDRFSK